jgi:hypothetical protein
MRVRLYLNLEVDSDFARELKRLYMAERKFSQFSHEGVRYEVDSFGVSAAFYSYIDEVPDNLKGMVRRVFMESTTPNHDRIREGVYRRNARRSNGMVVRHLSIVIWSDTLAAAHRLYEDICAGKADKALRVAWI